MSTIRLKGVELCCAQGREPQATSADSVGRRPTNRLSCDS